MIKIVTVRKEGGSRCLALSPFIPIDWQFVTIEEIKKAKNGESVTIKINKVK